MNEGKTPGQIAYEAAAGYNGDVLPWEKAKQGTWEVAAAAIVAVEQDRLASELLDRGGYGTLQLNPNPHSLPRIKFVGPADVQPVSVAKIGDTLIVRNEVAEQGVEGAANQMSLNGHETNGQLATRNLSIAIDKLQEMRWMVEKAGGDMAAFDRGVSQLDVVCKEIVR